MSNELVKFKQSYEDFVTYCTGLAVELSKSHANLVIQMSIGPYNFSEAPWVTLDNKTLAEFKALAIYYKIEEQLLPIIYPGIKSRADLFRAALPEQLLFPRKLNPQQLSAAFDSMKEIAQEALKEAINNRTGAEIILDFLKSCLNFLIIVVTFGQKPNFFQSSTSQFEKINQIQQDMHDIFEKLSDEEKITELDNPSMNLGNGFTISFN